MLELIIKDNIIKIHIESIFLIILLIWIISKFILNCLRIHLTLTIKKFSKTHDMICLHCKKSCYAITDGNGNAISNCCESEIIYNKK